MKQVVCASGFFKNILLAAVGGGLLVGCAPEPQEDPNKNDVPAVLDVYLDNGYVFGGKTGGLLPQETEAITGKASDGMTVIPSQIPIIRYNKLLNLDTIEKTSLNALTQTQFGYCDPVPGSVTILENGIPVPAFRACPDNSRKLVRLQVMTAPVPEKGDPLLYLKYNTLYEYSLTDQVKDKQGKSFEKPFSIGLKVGGFELLTLSNNGSIIYGSSVYGLNDPVSAGVLQSEDGYAAGTLRLWFSGPIKSLKDDSAATKTLNANVLQALNDNIKLMSIAANGTETEVSFTDENGDSVVAEFIDNKTSNPSIARLVPPDPNGFKVGKYALVIKADKIGNIKDAGVVMGGQRVGISNFPFSSAKNDYRIEFEVK